MKKTQLRPSGSLRFTLTNTQSTYIHGLVGSGQGRGDSEVKKTSSSMRRTQVPAGEADMTWELRGGITRSPPISAFAANGIMLCYRLPAPSTSIRT